MIGVAHLCGQARLELLEGMNENWSQVSKRNQTSRLKFIIEVIVKSNVKSNDLKFGLVL
jgi:hypothetical protein